MNTKVDLRQLAVRRETAVVSPTPQRSRRVVSRYLLPLAVVLAFVGLIGWAARDTLLPSRPVTVVPVLSSRVEIQQEGTPLFQGAGWVEPRPTPVLVTALSEGVIEKLLVVEGQEVRAGEPVARMIDIDARLSLQNAEADLRQHQAEATSARAALAAAKANLIQPVQLEAAVAEANAMLAQKENELAVVPFQLRTAQARLELARTDYESKKQASAAVPSIQLAQARNEWESATANAEELQGREARLRREVEALRAKRQALQRRLELKIEEVRDVAEAEAKIAVAEAHIQHGTTAIEEARLRLTRMVVTAPVGGRVLALLSRPGSRMMGLDPRSGMDASSVVSLYDPSQLQVRADVRLEDVPRIRPGQPVHIETPAAPGGPLHGEVLFPTSQADIQKNTLQVKVAITSPPPTLRPDMLVQVTYLAPPSERPPEASATLRLLVPRSLVEAGDAGPWVWLADQASGQAKRRAIKVGVVSGDLTEVTEGLNPGDRLIVGGREGLREGNRITVAGEDATAMSATTAPMARPTRLPQQK